jgi:hypothetical protein
LAGPEAAKKYQNLIFLAGSASAEFFADIALCPMEAVKVREQGGQGSRVRKQEETATWGGGGQGGARLGKAIWQAARRQSAGAGAGAVAVPVVAQQWMAGWAEARGVGTALSWSHMLLAGKTMNKTCSTCSKSSGRRHQSCSTHSRFEATCKLGHFSSPNLKSRCHLADLKGSGSTELIPAAVLPPPFLCLQVKVQTVPGYARGLADGLPKFVQQEGVAGLFKGITPLWGRQIPYTMMKFGEFRSLVGGWMGWRVARTLVGR